MKARICIQGCPAVSLYIEESLINGSGAVSVSVCCTETGGASYSLDPVAKKFKKLSGEYCLPGRISNLPDLPAEIVDAARASLARGGYNQGPVRDFFDEQALCLFRPLKSWHDGGKEEYYSLLDAVVKRITIMRERPGNIMPLVVALGLSLPTR